MATTAAHRPAGEQAGVKVDTSPRTLGGRIGLSGSAAACERAQVLIRRLINSDPDPWRGGDGDAARGGGEDRRRPPTRTARRAAAAAAAAACGSCVSSTGCATSLAT